MLIAKTMNTETAHRLTNYDGRCAHMHGHSLKWKVTVEGRNTDNGMVMDFKALKSIMMKTIDPLDHALVIHSEDPLTRCTEIYTDTNGESARLFVLPFNPTSENLVEWVSGLIAPLLPTDVQLVSVECWETESSFCCTE